MQDALGDWAPFAAAAAVLLLGVGCSVAAAVWVASVACRGKHRLPSDADDYAAAESGTAAAPPQKAGAAPRADAGPQVHEEKVTLVQAMVRGHLTRQGLRRARESKLRSASQEPAKPPWPPQTWPPRSSSAPIPKELDELFREALKHVDTQDLVVGAGSIFSRFRENSMNSFSIFERVPEDLRTKLVSSAVRLVEFDKAMGVMCGMALGDSTGHMFEFLPAMDEPNRRSHFFDVTASLSALSYKCFRKASNQFRIELGQWTDDASMGLCIADSLLVHRAFDGSDQRIRFWNWWYKGYNNAFRKDPSRSDSIGLGGNISKSLEEMKHGERPSVTYNAKTEDAGNGSLMRFAPVAVYGRHARGSLIEPAVYEMSKASSYTTHPGIIAAEACAFLCHVILRAFAAPQEMDAQQFLESVCAEYLEILAPRQPGWGVDQIRELVSSEPSSAKEACWNWKPPPPLPIKASLRARGRQYNGYPVSAGYFGSYSLDGLAMALHAVYHTSTFHDAIGHAVNLCGDADSTGSIAGQIAGAFYGFSSIPETWLSVLRDWDDDGFAVRGALLAYIAPLPFSFGADNNKGADPSMSISPQKDDGNGAAISQSSPNASPNASPKIYSSAQSKHSI